MGDQRAGSERARSFARWSFHRAATVCEPWPRDAPTRWREDYLAAFRLVGRDRAEAIARFEQLATERPNDPVPRIMAERLRKA